MSDAPRALRIGTRGSALARWQADHVSGRLSALPHAPPVEIVLIKTEGDRIVDVPLSLVPGKAFFTKEIEDALLEGRVDVAVHSLKDLATTMPDGLTVAAVLEREDPRDVLIVREGVDASALPPGARVGTSSLRRRALLSRWRPDLEILELRGNVPTRIRKLDEGAYEAIVLAAAGVKRLGMEARIGAYFEVDDVLPAVSQGAVAVQIREGDAGTAPWVEALDHPDTRASTTAERALLRTLEGGCQVPVGALARVEPHGVLHLRAVVSALDGSRSVEADRRGDVRDPEALGLALAEDLLSRGAGPILDGIRRALGER